MKKQPRAPDRSRLWRRVRFWIVYSLVVGAFSLVVLEVAVRMLRLTPSLPLQYSKNVSDPYLPWKPEPHSVLGGRTEEYEYSYRHNAVGFRDVEHTTEKPRGTFRIVGLGDSFTYGVGATFEETYLSQLESLLNQHFGGHPPVEIIKTGIPRYWPEPERIMLEHYGLSYAPNLVLVAFLPNDVIDTYVGLKGITVNQGFLVTRQLDPFGGVGDWLFVHSQLFRSVFFRYLNRQIEAEKLARSAKPRASDIYRAGGFHEADWREIEDEYERIALLSAHAGAKMAVVYIPQGPLTSDYPSQRLARWCAAHDVTFVDTLPALSAASAREAQYYPKDGHCTPAGYRTIAVAIYTQLAGSLVNVPPN